MGWGGVGGRVQVYARVCLALLDLKPLFALRGHGPLSPVEAGLGGVHSTPSCPMAGPEHPQAQFLPT